MHVVLGVDRCTQAKESNRRLASYKTGRKKVTDVLGKKRTHCCPSPTGDYLLLHPLLVH